MNLQETTHMTTQRKAAEVNRKCLRAHLSGWLRDPHSYSVTVQQLADMTGKSNRNVKRDIKRLRELQGAPHGDTELLTGKDFLSLLAGYHVALSFAAVDILTELYSEMHINTEED